ncbi:hypothetical protein [Burkholderia cepacia]|uniref:hypothetical protein n=1 Tax=Burkholderia cepacia TaxID=292 RepID=UPI001903710F|nr:hypothetical protein [Burkholderia cepacia]MBJ9756644.1 hypothetical protein [Burkholderia cepacia]
MRKVRAIPDTEEAKARARLLAHFVDHPEQVFYSRQLEVLFEREYFHWVTNRAVRGLIAEGFLGMEARRLSIGSEIKLVWNKKFRFYKRAANDVFELVDRYTSSATDGTLGMQGEHLVLAAFARRQFLLLSEESRSYKGVEWTETGHDLDFIFEKGGMGYGVEVKNTLGYLDVSEFVTKIRMARHIGVRPVFAVRALPKTWAEVLIRAGGYAMIMGFQFYPWTHKDLADSIREKLLLPVDTPKRIEVGTMLRFERWIESPPAISNTNSVKVDAMLKKIEEAPARK